MSDQGNELKDLLSLDAISAGCVQYPEYLLSLKEHPEYTDTAFGLLVRAVESKGLVDIAKQKPGRRRYLSMLASKGTPAYVAFDHVRGSHRLVNVFLKHFASGAAGGYQIRQMLTIIGPPGCGKSLLGDAFVRVLEGQIVYTVDGCPVHENPMNLLRLLQPEQFDKLVAKLGGHIRELAKSSLEPCPDCFRRLMLDQDGKVRENPNLSDVQVNKLRLSSRHAGISVWTPSADGCSLSNALRSGSRGLVRLPEAFSQKGTQPGKVSELQLLLEATEGRRIPGGAGEQCATSMGYTPFDGIILAETNKGAWDAFLKDQPDQDAFTRRNRIFTVPYNTVISEEVAAYEDFMVNLKQVPHVDPLALRMAAVLAIATRLPEEDQNGPIYPDLMTRMRLYDGEPLVIPKTKPQTSSSGYGSYSSTRPNTADAESRLNIEDMWKKYANEEGLSGLSIPYMLSFVSGVVEEVLSAPARKVKGVEHGKCVTTLTMLSYLRHRIRTWANTAKTAGSTTKAEDRMLERSQKYLKEITDLSDEPGLVEKEYRRLAKATLLQVFAPDYEQRANEDFERYRLHAEAFAQGKTKVSDPKVRGEIPVNTAFLDELDLAQGLTYSSDREKFRGQLTARINQILRSNAEAVGDGAGEEDKVTINWQTVPELAKAIKNRLDADIAKKVERIITVQVADLTEDEQQLRKESVDRLAELGHCETCRDRFLQYARDHKLWASQS